MIQGVMVKNLIRHPDERGFFQELIRSTDDFFSEGFAQLSHSHMVEGVVKAWHIHKAQVDWWFVAAGIIKTALYDKRESSPTYREMNEYDLGGPNKQIILKIPFGVAHGLKVMKGPADLIYVTSKTYDKDEEGRIAYDDKEIGYDWVQGKEITNKNIT
ncbi:dTDP-4-dehydrorhamnose 3,5-epimerase family protein [Patescibacteria group bacterium]